MRCGSNARLPDYFAQKIHRSTNRPGLLAKATLSLSCRDVVELHDRLGNDACQIILRPAVPPLKLPLP